MEEQNWTALLSTYRIGATPTQTDLTFRSDFQRDADRLLFSAAFRRMKDKTQVFPLEKNDYVRTRLSHSLEVSCVGRSLGSHVGHFLVKKYPHLAKQGIYSADIGDIVAAACLAHDIGNPPFGHFGEQAMRDYFYTSQGEEILAQLDCEKARADLRHIEGNAQGFRIVNRLENPDNQGGLRLTAATLAAASKYPSTAAAGGYRKNGVYQDDLDNFSLIFKSLELPQVKPEVWQRHPLSYLMEAADDICYLLVDIEDAYQVGQIEYLQALKLLADLAGMKIEDCSGIKSKSDQLAYLRAKGIDKLVHETVEVFIAAEESGTIFTSPEPLLKSVPSFVHLQALRDFAEKNIYISRPVVEIQIAGRRVLMGLMEIYCEAIARTDKQKNMTYTDKMILALLPTRFQRGRDSLYQKLLGVCDYISGMTDTYAVSQYQKLTGICLS